MSYMWVGNSRTDVGGNFNIAGSASFSGQFVKLNDRCGRASLGLNEGNSINWGTSPGTDCEFCIMLPATSFHFMYYFADK